MMHLHIVHMILNEIRCRCIAYTILCAKNRALLLPF